MKRDRPFRERFLRIARRYFPEAIVLVDDGWDVRTQSFQYVVVIVFRGGSGGRLIQEHIAADAMLRWPDYQRTMNILILRQIQRLKKELSP